MTAISAAEGWLIFLGYGVLMLGLVALLTRPERTSDEHLVANRNVSLWPGAFSIAVTWIWAPAVFIASQKSFEQGLAGIFWFTVPNVVTFFTFAPLALRLRRLMPAGYSLPDYVWTRYQSPPAHLAFLVVTLGYELGAIIINSLAGGILMHALTGIDLRVAIAMLAATAFVYTVWRGLPASIVTDVIQMSLLLFVAAVLVPWTVVESGGWSTVRAGLGGLAGTDSPLDPWVAYSFGIPATLGLLAGPVSDQMFYQRAMASARRRVVGTFVLGGLLFGIVPVTLSILGFLAASPSVRPLVQVVDPQMVSVAVVAHFLPRWTLFGFALMVLCALSSTLDSAYCAVGSLGSIDIYRRYRNRSAGDGDLIRASKITMLAFALTGTAIAMIPGLKLLWVFLIYGALASAALVPTVFVLYGSRLTARGAFWSVFSSFVLGTPLSIWGNVSGRTHLVVAAALATPLLGLAICLFDCRGRGDSLPAPAEFPLDEEGER